MLSNTIGPQESSPPTMAQASAVFSEAFSFVNSYRDYRLMDVQKMSQGAFQSIDLTFLDLANVLSNFIVAWSAAYRAGDDAFPTDMSTSLIQTGDLDMVKFGIVMRRMEELDKIIPALLRIKEYVDDFKKKCHARKISTYDYHIDLVNFNVDDVTNQLRDERERSTNLVERCNLYFQNRLSKSNYRLQFYVIGLGALAIIIPAIMALK